jgi:capsular polysaccharide biosynthesis protein
MTVLRRHVVVLVLATILGAMVAAVIGWSRPDEYRATARLFFISSAINVNDVYQATLAGTLRVNTYKVLASDQTVLNDAVRDAGVTMDPGTLQRNLHVDIPPGTLIMDISVDDPDPATAAKLANAVSSQLIALVTNVERPLGGGPAPVGLSVIQKAVPSATPQAVLDPIFVAGGALVGLVIGGGIAFVVNAVRRRQDNAEATIAPSADESSIPASEPPRIDDAADTLRHGQYPGSRD